MPPKPGFWPFEAPGSTSFLEDSPNSIPLPMDCGSFDGDLDFDFFFFFLGLC